MTDPLQPPRGFIVDADRRFSQEGNRRFERAVRMLLWNIRRNTDVGELVVRLIAGVLGRRHLRIVPAGGECGEWQRNAHARPSIVGGVNLGSEVGFTPRCWQFGGVWDARAVLLHELTHALRELTGSWTRGPASRGYPNIEEFHATTVTNVLRSELRLSLRMGYGLPDPVFAELVARVRGSTPYTRLPPRPGQLFRMQSAPPPAQLTTTMELQPPPTAADLRWFSQVFADGHPKVAELLDQSPALARGLAQVSWSRVPFNPYRAASE